MMVYKYGALKPQVLDGNFQQFLDHQRLATAYYNELIEIERWKKLARWITETLQNERLDDTQKKEQHALYLAARRGAWAKSSAGWGTKQAMDAAVKAAMKTAHKDERRAVAKAFASGRTDLRSMMRTVRPRFQRHDGTGILAATVQGCTALLTDSVLKGTNHFSILGDGKHRVARLRLSDEIAIDLPIVYHRPLPPAARVITARVSVEKIGTRWIYSLLVTVDASPASRVTGMGKCSINFGWRKVPGGVRVAYAVGPQGEHECIVPDRLLAKQKHSESLRSHADEIADLYLGDGERRRRHRERALVGATNRELGHVRFTREQAMLHRISDREWWARRDRHLYQWERDEYTKVLRARAELYRLWARKIAALYDSCTIETFDLNQVISRDKKSSELDIPSARHYRYLVGPHYLRQEIAAVFGEALEVLPAAKNTITCHVCGEICKWDKARKLQHTCEHCGADWDQDANNAKNQQSLSAAE